MELRFSNAQSCQALKSGFRFHSCQRDLVFEIIAAVGFPTRYRVVSFSGINRIRDVHSFSGPNASRFLQGLNKNENLLFAGMCRVASSHSSKIGLFPPSDTNLFCGFNRGVFTVFGVRVASRFIGFEWCMSQIRFNLQVLSSLI